MLPSQYVDGKLKERACTYIADFMYEQDGKQVVEDTKSAITSRHAAYIIKRKLMLYLYKIAINVWIIRWRDKNLSADFLILQ